MNSVSAWLEELRSSGEFTGKPGELAVLHLPSGLAAKRLAVVGGGKRDAFDAAALRKAAGSTVRTLKQKGVKTLAWWLAEGDDPAAAVEGAILGNFEPDVHKTSSKESKSLDTFSARRSLRHGSDSIHLRSAAKSSPRRKTSLALWRMNPPIS